MYTGTKHFQGLATPACCLRMVRGFGLKVQGLAFKGVRVGVAVVVVAAAVAAAAAGGVAVVVVGVAIKIVIFLDVHHLSCAQAKWSLILLNYSVDAYARRGTFNRAP